MLNASLLLHTHTHTHTQVYYITFLFLSSVVLINIFLAILVEAFSAVTESAQSSETLIEGLAYVGLHDLQLTHTSLPSTCQPRKSRFISDGKLRLLLDAWYETEAEKQASESAWSSSSYSGERNDHGVQADGEVGDLAPVIRLSD
jgi:hypothetical protein